MSQITNVDDIMQEQKKLWNTYGVDMCEKKEQLTNHVGLDAEQWGKGDALAPALLTKASTL